MFQKQIKPIKLKDITNEPKLKYVENVIWPRYKTY